MVFTYIGNAGVIEFAMLFPNGFVAKKMSRLQWVCIDFVRH
jgi:hypothetical protein